MKSYVAVYVGGPRHGEVEERQGESPPPEIKLEAPDQIDWREPVEGRDVVYELRVMADTPGRFAYVYRESA